MGRRSKEAGEAYRNGDVVLGRANKNWVAEYRSLGGKRQRKALVSRDRPEAEARRALDAFVEAKRILKAQGQKLTTGELWKLWMADRERDGLSNKIYMANWASLGPFFANRYPENLERDDWREYARQRFAKGIANATVHTELSRLSICYKWAASVRLIPFRPAHWLPQDSPPRDRVLTRLEARRLLDAAKLGDPHVYPFIVLLFATAGRHKAVLDLEWTRVDFINGTIDLEVDIPPDPMNKSWRKGRAHVVMSKLAREVLTEIYEGRSDCGFVIEHGGKRLKTCREAFASACKRAGIEGVTPHTIRHTVASWARGRTDIENTAQTLGHEDSDTTRKVYTHHDVATTRDVIDVVDEALSPMITIGG